MTGMVFSRLVLLTLAVLVSAPPLAAGRDWGESEGHFYNQGEYPLLCLRDEGQTDYVCAFHFGPGEHCDGDAVGTAFGAEVFKIPNTARFDCYLSTRSTVFCLSREVSSDVLLQAASWKNGGDSYGRLPWERFTRIMGDKPVIRCPGVRAARSCTPPPHPVVARAGRTIENVSRAVMRYLK